MSSELSKVFCLNPAHAEIEEFRFAPANRKNGSTRNRNRHRYRRTGTNKTLHRSYRVMNAIVAPWKVRLRLSKDARAETDGGMNSEPRLNAIGEAV